MNRKALTHGIMIAAIVVAAFVAAALTPVRSHTDKATGLALGKITEAYEINHASEETVTMISDNEIPLAASPAEAGLNMNLGWIIVSVSAVMSGIVIYEDIKDRRSGRA